MESKEIDFQLNFIDNSASWFMDLTGDSTNSTYKGLFVFKCLLTPLDTLAAGRDYRNLLGNDSESANESEKFLAFSLSQLKYRILKHPPFWDTNSLYNGNIEDLNIISTVLDKAISAELIYKENLKKKKEEALNKATKAIEQIQKEMNEKPNENK